MNIRIGFSTVTRGHDDAVPTLRFSAFDVSSHCYWRARAKNGISYVGRVQPAPLSFKTSVRLAPALLNTGICPSDWAAARETILGYDNESMRRNTPAAIDALR